MPAEAIRAFAPGRVNLIGEHTDYNDGLCLPFAVDHGVTVTAEPARGADLEARALDLGEEDRFDPRSPKPAAGWRALVRGVVAELRSAGVAVPPLRLTIEGDLPRGAGLGSSAALGVALCLALCAAAGAEPPPAPELARLCARMESDWAGQRTGLLDQLASLHGRAGHAVRLDMRGLRVEPVPLDLRGHLLAMLDSGAPRELAASGYNRRRAECERAARLLGLRSLRDAAPDDHRRLPEPLAGRVRHVISENARVVAMTEALRAGDLLDAGRLLDASHASVRDDYEASAPAVDKAVIRAKEAGALGARVHGGGFGGHVLALFPPDASPPVGALAVLPGPGARVL